MLASSSLGYFSSFNWRRPRNLPKCKALVESVQFYRSSLVFIECGLPSSRHLTLWFAFGQNTSSGVGRAAGMAQWSRESTRLPPIWPRSMPVLDVICELSLLVLYFAPSGFPPDTPVFPRVLRFSPGYSGFPPGTPVFPPPQNPTFALIWFVNFSLKCPQLVLQR